MQKLWKSDSIPISELFVCYCNLDLRVCIKIQQTHTKGWATPDLSLNWFNLPPQGVKQNTVVVVKPVCMYLNLYFRRRHAGRKPVFTDTCRSCPPCQHHSRATLPEINLTATVKWLVSLWLGQLELAQDKSYVLKPKFLLCTAGNTQTLKL